MFLIVAVTCIVAVAQTSDRPRNEMPMLGELKDPQIIIRKKRRTLEVYDGGKLIKTFTVVLGFAPAGDKEIEGDGKTPEGEFYVFTKNAESKFHLSLGLSYPAKEDAKRGLDAGVITKSELDEIVSAIDNKTMPPQKTALGGEIYIHGGGTESDWTWGCVALKNEEIEELFTAIPVGTLVTIKP
jgi:murein L,D-transpeptidase YafK